MCGPIALALPGRDESWLSRVAAGLTYNVGRILTYMFLGAIFGLLGKGLHLAGFQLLVSVIAGALMIALVVIPLIFKRLSPISNVSEGFSVRLVSGFRSLFGKTSFSALFGIGLLNGILPCGLVYVALAGAINTGDAFVAAVYMALFGAGTIPMMLSVTLAGKIISQRLRFFINKLTPYLIVMLGILFILRGLSLGIPYLSPKAEVLTPVVEKARQCCRPE